MIDLNIISLKDLSKLVSRDLLGYEVDDSSFDPAIRIPGEWEGRIHQGWHRMPYWASDASAWEVLISKMEGFNFLFHLYQINHERGKYIAIFQDSEKQRELSFGFASKIPRASCIAALRVLELFIIDSVEMDDFVKIKEHLMFIP